MCVCKEEQHVRQHLLGFSSERRYQKQSVYPILPKSNVTHISFIKRQPFWMIPS